MIDSKICRSSKDSSKPYEAETAEFKISEVICKTCKYPEREGHTESPHHKSNVFYKTERETILEKIRPSRTTTYPRSGLSSSET